MWPCLVHARDQQTNPIRSLPIMLCIGLSPVTYLSDDPFEGNGSAICHLRRERLLFHEVRQYPGVGREAGEGYAEMVVYTDDFLLVGGELFGVSLAGNVSAMASWILAFNVWRTGQGATFSATKTACVLLTSPTTTEPCLTASEAYSTWKIRPCGELSRISNGT